MLEAFIRHQILPRFHKYINVYKCKLVVKAFLVLFFSWTFITMFAESARAETIKAKVTADEVSYDYESKQVVASGNVKIEYRNIKIESDEALIDQDQDILLATGNVIVDNKGDIYHGDRFLYYLKNRQGWISPLEAEVTDPEINGPVKMTAHESFIKGEEIRSKHASFSSCNLAHPHYHFTAKEIEYYPGDIIIMRHVWYWEHRIPLFYLPVLYISLKNDNFQVKFGKSISEGWFIDVNYYYYYIPDDYSWGKIHTRFTEYGGNFYELENKRYTSHTGTFTQRYGFLDKQNMNNPDVSDYDRADGAEYESQYNDYMIGFGYEEYLNPVVKTTQTIENWHHYTENGDVFLDTKYNFSLSGQSPYPNSMALDFSDIGEDTYRKINFTTNWNYRPDDTSNVSLNGQWYSNGYLKYNNPHNNRLYNLKASKDWNWSRAEVSVYESKNYNNTYSSSTNKKPDIIYTIPKWQWPLINDVEVKTQYTKLEHFSNYYQDEGERYALNIHKIPVVLWEKNKITIDTTSDFKYRDFFVANTESELYAISAQIGVKDQFTDKFYTKFDFGFTRTDGLTNSYFGYDGDNTQPGGFVKNGWYYTSQVFRASLNTEYNFQTKYAYPANISADWTPKENEKVSFSTVYDWYLGLGQTNLNVFYNPKENWKLIASLGYNFQNPYYPWTMKQFEAVIYDKISDNWRYEIAARYDYLMDDFIMSEYALIYDWHCREVKFHYDGILKEYWVQIFIKAFPGFKVQYTGENTWENLVNEIGSQ